MGTDFEISVDSESTEATGENRGNEYLSIFSAVDLIVIVAVIQRFQQAEAVRRISSLSPTALFGYGAESINGTGVLRDQLLVQEAHLYRNTVEEWLRDRDSADPQSPHLCFQPGYLSRNSLNSASVPRNQFREATVAEGLQDALWKVILLSAETLMMLFAAVWAFQRYDVR